MPRGEIRSEAMTKKEDSMESRAKFLGHPIHPMLIPFPLGLLGMAVIFDLLAIVADQDVLGQACLLYTSPSPRDRS